VLAALLSSAQHSEDATFLLGKIVNSARNTDAWLVEGSSTVENGSGGDPDGKFRLAWRAPGLARYESGGTGSGRVLVVCDGAACGHTFQTQTTRTKWRASGPAFGTHGIWPSWD
jgi:hypothetical protein